MNQNIVKTYTRKEWPFTNEIVEEYQVNGRRHREDGPAFISNNNGVVVSEVYYKEGKMHREDGPARVERIYDDSNIVSREEYYKNGLLHREDGPASVVRAADGNIVSSEHWIEGRMTHPRLRPQTVRGLT